MNERLLILLFTASAAFLIVPGKTAPCPILPPEAPGIGTVDAPCVEECNETNPCPGGKLCCDFGACSTICIGAMPDSDDLDIKTSVCDDNFEDICVTDENYNYCLALEQSRVCSRNDIMIKESCPLQYSCEKIIFVCPNQVDCVGVALQKCYQVKFDVPNNEWQYFYDEIMNFQWTEGYEYQLRVRVVPIENPPADASSLRYELLEVVNQKDTTANTPDDDIPWYEITCETPSAETCPSGSISSGVVVKDDQGVPVMGKYVSFLLNVNEANPYSPVSAKTDANGKATFIVTTATGGEDHSGLWVSVSMAPPEGNTAPSQYLSCGATICTGTPHHDKCPSGFGVIYAANSAELCAVIGDFFCRPGLEAFFGPDDCGCGCKPLFCGGFAGFECPDGSFCIDDPDDDCDPLNGGADCGGLCQPYADNICLSEPCNANSDCTKLVGCEQYTCDRRYPLVQGYDGVCSLFETTAKATRCKVRARNGRGGSRRADC